NMDFPIVGVSRVDASSNVFDGIILVTDKIESIGSEFNFIKDALLKLKSIDDSVGKDVAIGTIDGPMKRVIFSPTGPLDRDYDDVRRFGDAAGKGVERALSAGCKKPLLVTIKDKRYKQCSFASAMGALQKLYVPLEIREALPEKKQKVEKFGLWSKENVEYLVQMTSAFEKGKIVSRDIGASDPERMAPPKVAEYVLEAFRDTCVKVTVESDLKVIEKNYPCLAAVNRCASVIDRHGARVVRLFYEGEGPITNTVFLVGKGVTYDTGGADVKAGGNMAGMHRDKCGAATVAGILKIFAELKPKHLKVCGTMSMVRNSIGANCYVADEIITSRAGVRLRIGNTDAEGRMAMADCLCEAKEEALAAINPQLYTLATLTGHAILAVGPNYTLVMDNGPAKEANNSIMIQIKGHVLGDPCEMSTIRREDYEFHTGKSEYEDVLQAGNKPSTQTPRGHQGPAAFLIMASGLDKHGLDSNKQLKYTHVDNAAAVFPFPGIPEAKATTMLAARYIMENPHHN
uniref:Cytosol aminopeptidase domain-containing protein n=1 Tax=Ciona intestinalis TaxID=7719 RepID=F6S5A6_CIOIN